VFALKAPGFIPDSVTTATNGTVWFSAEQITHCGTTACRREEIGTASSAGITEAAIGPTSMSVFGAAPGPDSSVWVTDALNAAYIYVPLEHLEHTLDLGGALGRALTPPFVGPDGRVWFRSGRQGIVGVDASYNVATIAACPKCGLGGGVTAPDGNAWFYDAKRAGLVRMTAQGDLEKFPGPQYLVDSLTAGPGGALWGLRQATIEEYSTVPNFIQDFPQGISPEQSGIQAYGGALYWTTYQAYASGRNLLYFVSMTYTGDMVRLHYTGVGACGARDRQFFAHGPSRGIDGHWYVGVGCSPQSAPYTTHGHGYIVRL
jgi:streptogramin lyase